MDKIAHLKEKELLDAFGIRVSSESSESGTNEELLGEETEDVPGGDIYNSENDVTSVSTNNEDVLQDRRGCSKSRESLSCDELRNSTSQLLDILRSSDFNWLEFVNTARLL